MVNLDDSLHREARIYAARSGITLAALVEEALRLRLGQKEGRPKSRARTLPAFRGDGLQPGVSVDHMEDVYDRMGSSR